ncbi:hypothetical protein P22_2424 [Propionispora sp. 2/2-37]|uniref:HD domain-containing protein n=1 Tax=Propionispora sp. 2/2-37 TaxID=1677858 RepID=UPI0006BB7139|nr:HD domain-containing protein [Propionispora sp. 2/2-37]CUH96334.1 hypothetical protein P22_2424 [Propionispora sp. 2/2-37]
MLSRIRQVMSALTARIGAEERQWINQYLTVNEQQLFWGMSVADQRHALNVAYSALRLAESNAVSVTLLLRCALLHDVGKVSGDISTIDKIIAVLVSSFVPEWAQSWGKPGKGSRYQNLRHAFYVHFYHPQRSAQLLTDAGTEARIIDIVQKHHKTPAGDDPPELIILRKADAAN